MPRFRALQAFGIYAVGFVSRPVGAALFGPYGDRIGRKVTLIATLLLTGLSTFAVGFVRVTPRLGNRVAAAGWRRSLLLVDDTGNPETQGPGRWKSLFATMM